MPNFEQLYDVRFCKCGHIHSVPNEYWDWMSEDYAHRQVMLVCTNCGKVTTLYLTRNPEGGYDMNSGVIKNAVIWEDSDIQYRIIFSEGVLVPVKDANGIPCGYADYYNNRAWFSEGKRVEPDAAALINAVKDPILMKSISGYTVGINWTGTEYER